eukprot:3011940-Rhodomonas_salina.1
MPDPVLTQRAAMLCPVWANQACVCLRACYAMAGADAEDAALAALQTTRSCGRGCNQASQRKLASANTWCAVRLPSCYEMSGTDIRYWRLCCTSHS